MTKKDDATAKVNAAAVFASAVGMMRQLGVPIDVIASSLSWLLATAVLALVDYDEEKAKEAMVDVVGAAINESLSTLADARDEFVAAGMEPPPGVNEAIARYKAKNGKGRLDA